MAAVPESLPRHLIDFDPRRAGSYKFAEGAELATVLRPSPIPWPDGLTPTTVPTNASPNDPLPAADVLVVTYTMAEGYALADVLTPGHDATEWTPYRDNWSTLTEKLPGRAPCHEEGCLARWALTTIGGKRVVVVKSQMHPATDGPSLPVAALWEQMVAQVQPRLVLTTGTAGGIGADTQLGDVVVSSVARWDCQRQFKHASFAGATFTSPLRGSSASVPAVADLLAANASHLDGQRSGPLRVVSGSHVITTDFFAMDTADDHFGLRAFDAAAGAVEMDDAALPLALAALPQAPAWLSVRNASDPQMKGADLQEEEKQAASIYERFGYWTSIGSVITCWSVIASLR